MKNFPNDPRASRSLWAKIPQEVKIAVFSAVVIGITVALLREPSPSTQKPLSPIAKTTVPTPPLEGLNTPLPDVLSSPIDPLVQIPTPQDLLTVTPSPLPTIPLPDSLISSSPTKKPDLPLSVTPSPGKIPKQNQSSSPIDLPSPSPIILPSAVDGIGDTQAPSADTANQKASTNKNAIVADVRKYFKKGWNPPSNLTQDLTYSVLLNADGTIQQILPLSNAATTYINSTPLPEPGKSLASQVEGGSPTGINLVFTKNGTIEVTLEEVNLPNSSPSSSPGTARP